MTETEFEQGISIVPIPVAGEVTKGENIGDLVAQAFRAQGIALESNDVVVVTQKIVSKAEGRIVPKPEDESRHFELVRSEAVRIVRSKGRLVIAETPHGFVCANSGIDSSNIEEGFVGLLPVDPDRSARRIRSRLKALCDVDVAVIISDTFGRAWRVGQTNIAIGLAGFSPFRNYRGSVDAFGMTLRATNIAEADELAGAAELVMGKAKGIPLALIRGAILKAGRGSARELVRRPHDDLFR